MKKVIEFKQIILDKTEFEVNDILSSLREDYEIPVKVNKKEIQVLLREFYQYYESKEIQYHFFEMMTGHFEDIALTAIEFEEEVNIDFILEQMKLLELVDSPIEVIPPETRKVIQKIRKSLERGPKLYEGKHH